MPFAAPCPNCGASCSTVNSLLYCPDCRNFVGRPAKPGKGATAPGTPVAHLASAADYTLSPEVQAANDSLQRAHEFEDSQRFRDAGQLYARLGLIEDAQRVAQALAEHPESQSEIPDD